MSSDGDLIILGDKIGLEFLADCALSIIGKHDPGGHIHLEWQMNTLLPGSLPVIVEFSDDDDDYREVAE